MKKLNLKIEIKRSYIILIALLLINSAKAQQAITYTFEPDNSNILNPERGFYIQDYISSNGVFDLYDTQTLDGYRNTDSVSLVLRVYYLEKFVGSDISSEYLENMRKDFAVMRSNGIKAAVRFAYTDKYDSRPYGDAPYSVVLRHIEQLKPVLRENADVIFTVQAGFIGAWGEWFYTDYFATQYPDVVTDEQWEMRRQVVYALLDALPQKRCVALRTPYYKQKVTARTTPLTKEEAYSGSNDARISHHNDCFLASASDVGTYRDSTTEKPYLAEETKYLVIGGETCGECDPYSLCPNALSEMKRFHWTYLHVNYHPDVISQWKTDGCFADIQKKLGYRYQINSAILPDSAMPGGEFNAVINLVNLGWANPVNPRNVELLLVENTTGEIFFYKYSDDIRLFEIGSEIQINLNLGLKEGIPEGDYSVYLSMPDPEPTLHDNPLYAIRTANLDTWNQTMGANLLASHVIVSKNCNYTTYQGNEFIRSNEPEVITNESDCPLAPLVRETGSKSIVYWPEMIDESSFFIIQRSADGSSFTNVAIKNNFDYMWVDTGLEYSQTYQYRLVRADGNDTVYASPASSITTGSADKYIDLAMDGDSSDWDPVVPLCTGDGTSVYAVKMFNVNEDIQFAIESDSSQYAMYFNSDNDTTTGISNQGFDAKVSNDTIYVASSNEWAFVKTIATYRSEGFVEGQFTFSDINLNSDACSFIASVDGVRMPKARENAVFARTTLPDAPLYFKATNSELYPATKIILTWEKAEMVEKYVIERSVDDTLHFEKLTELDALGYTYHDNTVNQQHTYYYRMFIVYGFLRSAATAIVGGVPGYLSVDDNTVQSGDVVVYPNPAKKESVLKISYPFTEKVEVVLYDITGKIIFKVSENCIKGEMLIPLGNYNLTSGIYLLKTTSVKGTVRKKITLIN